MLLKNKSLRVRAHAHAHGLGLVLDHDLSKLQLIINSTLLRQFGFFEMEQMSFNGASRKIKFHTNFF
jgi:hypothetical protein